MKKKCPFCAEEIQAEAIKCRYCGEFLHGHSQTQRMRFPFYAWGFEYKSKAEFLGVPLVHVAYGPNPKTGFPRLARGIIAVGNFAIGVVAIGGIALGGLTLAGIGMGGLVVGGISVGILALGGLSIGAYFALGGLAISASYAIGALALGPRSIGISGTDREFYQQVENFWLTIRNFIRSQ